MSKSLVAGLQTHLESGTTTMVHCWKITRSDGVIMGFTEHDRNLEFDGVLYLAATGFSSTKMAQSVGLAVDNLNADGVLTDDTITEKDLDAGRYDDAEVQLYWVNYNDVTQRHLKTRGYSGQTKRTGPVFSTEIRSLVTRLQQNIGNSYSHMCPVAFGGTECGLDLGVLSQAGVVSALLTSRKFTLTGIVTLEKNYFEYGTLTFTSGLNNGLLFGIKSSGPEGVDNNVELWEIPPYDVAITDTITLAVGCDKVFSTCKGKFNNSVNFRGHPHIPGSDFLGRYALRDSSQNGESLYGN